MTDHHERPSPSPTRDKNPLKPAYRKTEKLEHARSGGAPLTIILTERPDGPA